jgi:hypothetical protein
MFELVIVQILLHYAVLLRSQLVIAKDVGEVSSYTCLN